MNKKKLCKIAEYGIRVLATLIMVLGLLLLFGSRWMLNYWPNMTMEELMYQLSAPAQGASKDIYLAFFKSAGLPVLLILVIVVFCFHFIRKKSVLCFLLSAVIAATGVEGGISAKDYVWENLSVTNYLENQTAISSVIDQEYVDPKTVALTFPEEKRNLIYIFLESMEVTFADQEHGGYFEASRIPELTELAEEGVNFSYTDSLGGFRPTSGTTWTMGGIFAQTSGLPLKIEADNNDMAYQDSFFPEFTCLGDILQEEGYQQAFLLGSDVTFGGRANYYTEHGNAELLDYYWAIDQGYLDPDYYVWWGYEDTKLMGFAKEQLTRLAAEDQPFCFTMLTVDTHCQNGYVCEKCRTQFESQYSNVYSCSSRQAAELVEWIREQDFYDNTTIILAGDHNTMDVEFNKGLDKSYTRYTYNCFLNAACEPVNEKNRIFTSLDMFPSTLAAMGVEIEGNRLGLGTNLFSEEETLGEKYTFKTLNEEISKNSLLFEQMNQDVEKIWQKDDKGTKFYIVSEKRFAENEWVEYDPKRGKNEVPELYFFDRNGYRVKGWNKIDGEWCFFRNNGTYVYHPEDSVDAKAARKINARSYDFDTENRPKVIVD